jgi:hypothetical protein
MLVVRERYGIDIPKPLINGKDKFVLILSGDRQE